MAAAVLGKGTPGNVLDSKIQAAHATDEVSFGGAYHPNAVLLDAAGTITIRKVKDGASEAFALAAGIWIRMPPFDRLTAASATTHIGLVE